MDNARTQILDCHLHFRQFPSAKIAQMLETAKLNGNILHVDSLCLTLYCFWMTCYFENSFCSIGSCFRNKMRSFSRRFRSRRLCFRSDFLWTPFHLWKNYLLGHPTLRGWSKRLAPKWFITAKKLVSHLVWIRLVFPVCASDGRAGFFFWRENDFVANLDENVNINIKEVVFRIKYITFPL